MDVQVLDLVILSPGSAAKTTSLLEVLRSRPFKVKETSSQQGVLDLAKMSSK
jgi:hypothetical protein